MTMYLSKKSRYILFVGCVAGILFMW